MSNRGRFIVFEGLDGAGTTTQAHRLAEWLRKSGRRVHETAEPSTGPVGRLIRQILKGELDERQKGRVDPRTIAALFVADRADHLTEEIEPQLEAGADVVCDRYLHSSLAYQSVDCDPHWVAAINEPMRSPDLILYLKVAPDLAGRRRADREGPVEIYEHDDFQHRVAIGYDAAGVLRPEDPMTVVDGSGTIDEVQTRCRAVVRGLGPDTTTDGEDS